jgi:hypothetical protein
MEQTFIAGIRMTTFGRLNAAASAELVVVSEELGLRLREDGPQLLHSGATAPGARIAPADNGGGLLEKDAAAATVTMVAR